MRAVAFAAVMVLAGAAHATDWRDIAVACEQYGETSDEVCPGHVNCPGWDWVTRCVAEHALPPGRSLDDAQRTTLQTKLDRCISTVTQQRRIRHESASTGGAAIADALHCAGLIK